MQSSLRNAVAILKPTAHLTNPCSTGFTMSEFAQISPLSVARVDKGVSKAFVFFLERSCTVSRRLDAISAEARKKQERLTSGAIASTVGQR
jgi:hypothetical protein